MDKVTFYRDAHGEWRWTRRDEGNHKITGASSEGYVTYRDCFANAASQFGETVVYERWPHEDTGDEATTLTVEDDN